MLVESVLSLLLVFFMLDLMGFAMDPADPVDPEYDPVDPMEDAPALTNERRVLTSLTNEERV